MFLVLRISVHERDTCQQYPFLPDRGGDVAMWSAVTSATRASENPQTALSHEHIPFFRLTVSQEHVECEA